MSAISSIDWPIIAGVIGILVLVGLGNWVGWRVRGRVKERNRVEMLSCPSGATGLGWRFEDHKESWHDYVWSIEGLRRRNVCTLLAYNIDNAERKIACIVGDDYDIRHGVTLDGDGILREKEISRWVTPDEMASGGKPWNLSILWFDLGDRDAWLQRCAEARAREQEAQRLANEEEQRRRHQESERLRAVREAWKEVDQAVAGHGEGS